MKTTLGIDQSISGTGICWLDDMASDPRPQLETINTDDEQGLVGMARTNRVISRICEYLDKHQPELVVMEEYAMGIGKGTNNLTRLAELGGVIKWESHRRGYQMGYGTGRNKDERENAWESTRLAAKLFVVQGQSGMKAFNLGDGGAKKDSRYLLTVHEKTGMTFPDDNQADAWMHANMASLLVSMIRGNLPFGNLLPHQQEALLDKNRPKGMSLKQALKLPDAEKLALIRL